MFQTHRGRLVRSGHLPRASGGERRTEVQAEGTRLCPNLTLRPGQMGSCQLLPVLQSPQALLGSPSQDGSGPRPGGTARLSLGRACRLTAAGLCCVCRADTSVPVLCAAEAEQEP